LFLLAFLLPVQAAPLNLPYLQAEPLVNSNGTYVDYVYTPVTTSHDGGGTLRITGLAGTAGVFGGGQAELNGASYNETSSQIIKMPGATLDAFISATIGGTPYAAATPYLLEAAFDAGGNFTGGSVRVDGFAIRPFFGSTVVHPSFAGFNSGTILTMNLTSFGFTGTPNGGGSGTDNITLEWLGDITGGDLFDMGNMGTGGVVGIGSVDWNGGSFGGAWDPGNTNDMSAFLQSFSTCTDCDWDQNTFIPVPAAVWLFGSGLLGLIGISRRRRK